MRFPLKARSKGSTISSAWGGSGWGLSTISGPSFPPRTRLPSRLPGFSAYWDRHPREFGQRSSELPYSSSVFSWERATTEDHRAALANLIENTGILAQTSKFTPLVNDVLNQILCMASVLVFLQR